MNSIRKREPKQPIRKVPIKNPLWKENFESMEELYDDAQVFVNGSCHLFAYALNDEYGYDIVEIKGTKCNAQHHYFCRVDLDEKTVYLDVRGATTCCYKFLNELGYNENDNFIVHSRVEFEKDLSEEGAKFGYGFAKYIIHTYPQNYDLRVDKNG